MSVWSIALAFFLVANPIGNIPTFLSLVKDFEFSRQKMILLREGILSFFIAIGFLFIGEPFLQTLSIQPYAVSMCGGILLFIVAINMIFPPQVDENSTKAIQEPFIVPIATPLITGGGVMTTILIYSKAEQNIPKILLACVLAWSVITAIVYFAAYLQKILGKRGLLAMEQLMGMLLSMLSMELIIKGLHLFISTLQQNS